MNDSEIKFSHFNVSHERPLDIHSLVTFLNVEFLHFTETAVGGVCDRSMTMECIDHSSCVSVDIGYKCICNDGYYDNNGTCTEREFTIKTTRHFKLLIGVFVIKYFTGSNLVIVRSV